VLASGKAAFIEWEYLAGGQCSVLEHETGREGGIVVIFVRDVIVTLVPVGQLDALEAAN